MADTGKIARLGFGAGAIAYAALLGFAPNATPGLNPGIASMGFGVNAIARVMLFGFSPNAAAAPDQTVYFYAASIGGGPVASAPIAAETPTTQEPVGPVFAATPDWIVRIPADDYVIQVPADDYVVQIPADEETVLM